MNWYPAHDTYLVIPDEIVVSPLVLAEFKKNHVETMTGRVVVAGKLRTNDGGIVSLRANVGDKVMFGSKVGAEIKIEGVTYLLVADANVLLIQDSEDE